MNREDVSENSRNHKSLRQRARWAALERLIDAHRQEYEQLHREEREARGLPSELDRAASDSTISRLRARVRELERQLPT
jgi:hypothetical protein